MQKKHVMLRRMSRALLLALTVMLTTGCGSGTSMQASPTPLPVVADLSGVTAEGRLEPVRFTTLSPGVSGLVSEVLVAEGEQVEMGQLLARLDGANAESLEAARTKAAVELSEAYQAVRTAQKKLDDFSMPRAFVGLGAEEAAGYWLAELDAAREAFAPYKDTSRKGLRRSSAFPVWVYPSLPQRVLYDTREYDEVAMVFKKRLDVAWMNYTKAVLWVRLDSALVSAQARLADAQRRYDSLQDPSMPEAAAGTRAALATAEIRAPYAGIITTLDLKVGEAVQAGKPVATLADVSTWVVKTIDLTEIDVVAVKEGQHVKVTLDAVPGPIFHGTVLAVALDYSDRQGDIVYPVEILLQENEAGMRWGMTAQVTFEQ